MPSRVVGLVVGVLLAGAIGFWLGRSQQQPGIDGEGCSAVGTIEYHVDSGKANLIGNTSVEAKALLLDGWNLDPGKSEVCWDFRTVQPPTGVSEPDFEWVHVKVAPVAGQNGPILVGSGKFDPKVKTREKLRYQSLPNWTTIDWNGARVEGSRIGYEVFVKIKGQEPIKADPDIIIIKDKPRYI